MLGVAFLLLLCFGYSLGYCENGWSCGYNECCYSIYSLWYFWVIIIVVFILKVACITCYVRRRRLRANIHYVTMPPQTITVNSQQQLSYVPPNTNMPPPSYPTQQNQLPPPPSYPGVSGEPPMDFSVPKDTKMLIA